MGHVYETFARPFSRGAKACVGYLGASDIHEVVKNHGGGFHGQRSRVSAAGQLAPPVVGASSVDRIADAANCRPRLARFANGPRRTPEALFGSRRLRRSPRVPFPASRAISIASAMPSGARSRFLGWGSTLLEAITCRPTLSPLCLGDCLGLDHDLGQPIPSTLMFRSAWRKARTPRNIDQWQGVDPKGLEEFIELAEQSTPWAPPHVAVERKGRDIFDMIGEGGKDTRGIGFDLPTRTACSGG